MSEVYINGQKLLTSSRNYKLVDLSSLDNNKWYPYRIYKNPTLTSQSDLAITDLHKINIYAPLDISGSPSYGTHKNNGVFSIMTVLALENGWGIRRDQKNTQNPDKNFGYILDANNSFVSDNKKCIAFQISMNQLGFIVYLRGGLQYQVTFDSDLVGALYANGLTINGETYNPVSDEPTNDPGLIDLRSRLGGM